VAYAEPNHVVSIAITPDDPSFSQLWGLGDEVRVTVIATGFGNAKKRRRPEATPIQAPTNDEQPPRRPEPSDDDLEIPSFLRES